MEARVSTAERIVDAAVRLFNADGISRVSLRQIAEAVGISHGNLAYHYANKGEILDALYTRMESEMDDVVYPGGDTSLRHYHAVMTRISAFHDQYRFFYLDMLEVARRYPRVIRRYRRTVARRFEEHDRLMADLIGNGLLKREAVPGLYRSLFHSIWVMSTFWLQHKKILGENHPVIGSGSDITHVWEIMLPHLTPKGLREYRTICAREGAADEGRPLAALYLARGDR
jgi:AcrR family transcriptional regulator